MSLLTVQCSRRAPVSPGALYSSIEQRFISGELAQADTECLRVSPLVSASNPLWAPKFRLQQAKVRLYQGRYQEALLLLKPSLPGNPPDVSLAMMRSTLLSIAYKRTGDPARAAQALEDAEKLCPDELSCSGVQLAHGIVAVEEDRLADADRAFRLCLVSASASSDSFLKMQALLNLGVVALRQEYYDEALSRFRQASTVANAIGARLALEKATGNVGWALYKLGDFRQALANSQLAEQRAAALGSTADQVGWLNDSGLSQYRLGDLDAAKSSYKRSLQLAQSIQNAEYTGDALVALASLSLQAGDLPDALNRSREAQRIAEQRGNISDTLRPSLIEALVLEKQGKTSAAKNQLLSLELKSSAKPSLHWEIENALAKLSADAGDNKFANIWFRRAIEMFHDQRSSVSDINSRLPFVENGASLYVSYMEYLLGQGRFEDALRILDQGRAATLAEDLAGPAGNPREAARRSFSHPNDVARRLNATILVYCLRPATSYLWAITASRMSFFRLPGKEKILPLIESHTRAVLSLKDVLSQENAPGTALYHHLVEPAGQFLAPGGKVFVIADEGMNGLNFETLLTSGERPHFWIEDVTIINARSLSLLAKNGAVPLFDRSSRRLLLVGDPIYSGNEYERLPHATEEVASIARQFSPEQRMILTGDQATPAVFQASRPGEFAYIHFVTHGMASATDPLDSAVILSPQPGDAESYKLYARQILDQRLHADLVTISSCYGSGIRSYSGEGLVGLAWAFLRAGSHHVIGALWAIDDISTPQLMSDLYDGLAHGVEPAAALRSAKMLMIRRGGTFRKPFYWAPFQLYAGT